MEGDYVVLQHHAGGVLRIAPQQPHGRLRVLALKKMPLACPSQWEGVLEDGRVVYARYRHDGLDGFMDFEELKAHLYGPLEFPTDLVVENERPPKPDPEGIAKLFARMRDSK